MQHLMVDGKYLDRILSGKKTLTIRLSKPKLRPGDLAYLHSKGKIRAIIRIKDVRSKKFEELSEEDAIKDGFGSLEELKKALEEHYGKLEGKRLWLIEFEVVQRVEKEESYGDPKEIAQRALEELELKPFERRIAQLLVETGSIRKTAEILFGDPLKRKRIRSAVRKRRKLLERGNLGERSEREKSMVNENLLRSRLQVSLRRAGRRHDGRARDQPRRFEAILGVVERAQGSALVRLGKTHVLAVVKGPYEVTPRHAALPDRAILNVVYRTSTFAVMKRKKPIVSKRERELSRVIREALEGVVFLDRYPRSQIDVYVQVISGYGGTRTAGFTAAALALADAGIPMRDLVIGLAGGKVDEHIVIDLDDVEDKFGDADIPLGYLPNLKMLSMIQADGLLTRDELLKAVKNVISTIEGIIYPAVREIIMKKYGGDGDVHDR